MKILLANKFYYRRGGDCVYMLNLESMLAEKGHDVAVFAMQYPENIESEWSRFFPSEVEFKLGMAMFGAAGRALGTGDVVRKFNALLDKFQPDVVHLNNIHTQLSPVIAELAHRRGIRVVWTLHDYKLLCPRYDCRKRGEQICEECFGSKLPVLKHACMKNSIPASALALAEAWKWTRKRLEKSVDAFICPSEFLRSKMIQGGFTENKLIHLCNFIDVSKCTWEDVPEREDYCCYVGRISQEKGIGTLLKAAETCPDRNFVIVGDGPLAEELRQKAAPNVRFVGRKSWEELKPLVASSRFLVIPSEWYENNPLSVIEAKCLGTPVLGAAIGGIPELIDESCGMAFKSGDAADLATGIDKMFSQTFDYAAIAEKSRIEYCSDAYFDKLIRIYENSNPM